MHAKSCLIKETAEQIESVEHETSKLFEYLGRKYSPCNNVLDPKTSPGNPLGRSGAFIMIRMRLFATEEDSDANNREARHFNLSPPRVRSEYLLKKREDAGEISSWLRFKSQRPRKEPFLAKRAARYVKGEK